MRNAFHQAPVAHEQPGMVVNDVKAGLIELSRKRFSAIAMPTALATP